jgi:SPP1 gp7 family putative phage head morphogenesis protein
MIAPPRRASAEGATVSLPVTLSAEPENRKAGPIGQGAGVLMTEYNLNGALRKSPQDMMRDAARLSVEVSWIRAAERTICGPGSTVDWHIEDPEGMTIDADYTKPAAVEMYNLFRNPQRYAEVTPKASQRKFWYRTLRHMGICGPAFWFKDQVDAYGIPKAYIYIRPDRMSPVADKAGNLLGWLLDADKIGKRSDAIGIKPEEVVQFDLEPPDNDFMAVGLVRSAMAKILLEQGLDRHITSTLASGGRLSGILAPKMGVIDDDNIYQQIIRDWRNIAEQPEAAKRLQVVRYPVDFTQTAADLKSLEIVKLLTNARDELIELWGVPLSQLGGSPPAGLNSGDVRKNDQASLWQGAIHPRLSEIAEQLQAELDLWEPLLGFIPKIVIDEPEFTDIGPRFDLLAKSATTPLRNRERRDLVGLDPFGDKVIGPSGSLADDEVWMPGATGITLAFAAPEDGITDQSSLVQNEDDAPAKAKIDQADYVKAVLADLSHQYPAELISWVPGLTWEYDDSVKTKKIDGTRTEPINPKIVSAIQTAHDIGAPMDPLVLVDLPSQKKLAIANGYKRYAAAMKMGMKNLPAYVGTCPVGQEKDVTTCLAKMQDPEYQPPTPPTKASPVTIRSKITASLQPTLRTAASVLLRHQKQAIVEAVRAHAEHLIAKPSDTKAWWNAAHWDETMLAVLKPTYTAVAEKVHAQVIHAIPSKAAPVIQRPVVPPAMVEAILEHAGERIVEINETTRKGVAELILDGVKQGLSPAQLGDSIEAWSGWDEYRAERIATTELARAYNEAAIGTYRDAGIERLEAIDGDGDEECAARDGQIFSVDDAENEIDHPNGTLDWMPVIDDASVNGGSDE